MLEDLKKKILILELELKKRDNNSFLFFNELLDKINKGLVDDAVDSILKSFSIVQYGDFNFKEEVIFDEIWNIAEKIKNNLSPLV